MERLRVLFVIGSLEGGGSERQMIGLLKWLDREKFAPHLFLFNNGGALREEVPDDVPVDVFATQQKIPRFNWPGRIHGQQVRALARALRRWKIQCVYDRNFHSTLVTAPACRGQRVPRVSTVVSDPARDLITQETRFVSLKRKRLKTAYRTADRVIAVSEGVREALIEDFGVASERVVTIHSPLDLDRVCALSQMAPAIDLPADRYHIVGAGRLLEAKGWLDLFRAAEQLVHRLRRTTIQVHVLGEGPLRERLVAEISRSRMEDHFRLEGFQANPYAIFQNCQLLVHPSHYEGLPNVLLEAMACDLPVIATDCRWGPREILADGKFGALAPVGDTAALVKAMDAALKAHEAGSLERQTQIDAARIHVETCFGVEQSVRAIEQVIFDAPRLHRQQK